MNKWLLGVWLLAVALIPFVGSIGGRSAEIIVLGCLGIIGVVSVILSWRFVRSLRASHDKSSSGNDPEASPVGGELS